MENISKPARIYHWETHQTSNELPLSVVTVQGKWANTDLHSHDFEELLLVISGTGCYTTLSGKYQLEPGDCFLLHPGQIHGFSDQKHLVIYNVLWQSEKLAFDFTELEKMPGYRIFFQLEPNSREKKQFKSHFRLNNEQLAKAKKIIEEINEELLNPQDGIETALYSLLGLLFVMICRLTDKNSVSRYSLHDIADVIRYMEKNYARRLDRIKLSHAANMSEATFFRHFRQATGMSPMDYLRELRLNKAELLLRTTKLTLTEIADQCGFCDTNYFILCFRKHFDITPLRYRKLF